MLADKGNIVGSIRVPSINTLGKSVGHQFALFTTNPSEEENRDRKEVILESIKIANEVVRASDSRPEGLGSMPDATKHPPSTHGFTCRNCGGGDRGRVAIYRPFGEFRRAKIVLSPVWCSRPTTGVPLAHATMNFVGLDLTTSDSYQFVLAFRCLFETPSDFSGTNFDRREFPLLQTWLLANLGLVCSMATPVLSFLSYLGRRVWHVSESSPYMITCKPTRLRLAMLIQRSAFCNFRPMIGQHSSDYPVILHVLSQHNCEVLFLARATSALY
ncbi:hypothetical protein TNCV_2267701 [Trichonephila clavipes]|nr:hypothetical protein TNCV_2267701 [Trichonephila clavipes]